MNRVVGFCDREWQAADRFLLQLRYFAWRDGSRGADREHGAERVGDAASEPEQRTLGGEPEQRSRTRPYNLRWQWT